MTGTNKCTMVHKLWQEQTAGRRLLSSQERIVEQHLADCNVCKIEAKAIEYASTTAPVQPLNDLARRRFVQGVLDNAKVKGEDVLKPEESVSYLKIGAIAAAAVLAVATGIWWTWGTSYSPSVENTQVSSTMASDNVAKVNAPMAQQAKPPVAKIPKAPINLDGRFILSSGEVQLAESSNLNIWKAGTSLTVAKGQAVVQLPTGVTLFIDKNTQVRAPVSGKEMMELQLVRGRVFAMVDPGRTGPRFAVTTKAGKAVVTGTAFAVTAGDSDVELHVFRGSVAVDDELSSNRQVNVGHRAVFGQDGIAALTEEEEQFGIRKLKQLDMLEQSGGANVTIESLPEGADVVIDDVHMGLTPLHTSIRSGHRRIELSHEGYAPVKELVQIDESEKYSRVFDLTSDKKPRRHTKKSSLSAAQMLIHAQSFRAERNWAMATKAYENLIKHYPESSQARASYVSLANIQLGHGGRPATALTLYDAYLARSSRGTLAQEAAFGRAKALRRLGRTAEEKQALERFLNEFPGAIQTSKARRRLSEIK